MTDGEEEAGIWRLRDQLQGLRRHARVGHGLQAHRPLGDDQEDLGVREAEAAGQEVAARTLRSARTVLTPPGAPGRSAARLRPSPEWRPDGPPRSPASGPAPRRARWCD